MQQKAKVNIYGEFTKEIQISKGTRQRCPSSTLLFILTLKMLNEQIKSNKNIKALKIRDEFKLKVYTDHLIIPEDPIYSVDNKKLCRDG